LSRVLVTLTKEHRMRMKKQIIWM